MPTATAVQRFVDAFFSKIGEFQKPPRHVKWREVNIAATLPGWTRFPAAQEWLDNERAEQQARQQARGLADPASAGARQTAAARPAGPTQQQVDPALYQESIRIFVCRGSAAAVAPASGEDV